MNKSSSPPAPQLEDAFAKIKSTLSDPTTLGLILGGAGASGLTGGYLSSKIEGDPDETPKERRMRILKNGLMSALAGGGTIAGGALGMKFLSEARPKGDEDPNLSAFKSRPVRSLLAMLGLGTDVALDRGKNNQNMTNRLWQIVNPTNRRGEPNTAEINSQVEKARRSIPGRDPTNLIASDNRSGLTLPEIRRVIAQYSPTGAMGPGTAPVELNLRNRTGPAIVQGEGSVIGRHIMPHLRTFLDPKKYSLGGLAPDLDAMYRKGTGSLPGAVGRDLSMYARMLGINPRGSVPGLRRAGLMAGGYYLPSLVENSMENTDNNGNWKWNLAKGVTQTGGEVLNDTASIPKNMYAAGSGILSEIGKVIAGGK